MKYQQHITADIGHAVRQRFFATHDLQWMKEVGFELAMGTAEFWASRVTFNESTNRFDINEIMGPDEDHSNINNDAYSNVGAALNLYFGSYVLVHCIISLSLFWGHLKFTQRDSRYASCIRDKLNGTKSDENAKWSQIASKIQLLYDSKLDYNPQYEGYDLSIPIKQADVALLGYPLQYANVNKSTRRNNLQFYGNVTRPNGPAMTWSMHAIGHLDIDELPSEEVFRRTYVPYIRRPFYVWNEYVDGVLDGASNFITGAGGFLQLIMYGYAGIRINAHSLTIEKSTLPPQTTKLKLNGELATRFLFSSTISQKFSSSIHIILPTECASHEITIILYFRRIVHADQIQLGNN